MASDERTSAVAVAKTGTGRQLASPKARLQSSASVGKW